MRWGRVLFTFALGYVGFKIDGWAGTFSFLLLFFLGCFLFYYIFEPIYRDFQGLFSRIGGNTYNIHVNATPGQDGHPDVEGTARRHPDPTRPDDEEWAGAITYRLERGKR